jgi:hypothetical protein
MLEKKKFRKKERDLYMRASCHQLNDTTGLFNLSLRLPTHISSPDNHGHFRETTLAEKLCISE